MARHVAAESPLAGWKGRLDNAPEKVVWHNGSFGNGRKPIFYWLRESLNTKEQKIEALLSPTVKSLDCEIWGVELMSQGRHSRLRVYIDRPNGVSVEDCERVSRHVSDVLDVEDILRQSYTLEVSSPGLDRILFNADQYAASVGEQVEVRLNYPFEGRKRIVGLLAGIENDDTYGQVIVQAGDEQYLLPLENVQRARIVPQFD